jgi:hypothetical protein
MNFATKSAFRYDRLDENSWNERILKATKQLRFYCRGLVELSTGAECPEVLRFTHRSIPEFLHKDIVRQRMELHLEGFQVGEAVSQLCLAEKRSQRLLASLKNERKIWLWNSLHIIRHCLRGREMDDVTYNFLRCLDDQIRDRTSNVDALSSEHRISANPWRNILPRHDNSLSVYSTVMSQWAMNGDFKYITSRIERDTDWIRNINWWIWLLTILRPFLEEIYVISNNESESIIEKRLVLMDRRLYKFFLWLNSPGQEIDKSHPQDQDNRHHELPEIMNDTQKTRQTQNNRPGWDMRDCLPYVDPFAFDHYVEFCLQILFGPLFNTDHCLRDITWDDINSVAWYWTDISQPSTARCRPPKSIPDRNSWNIAPTKAKSIILAAMYLVGKTTKKRLRRFQLLGSKILYSLWILTEEGVAISRHCA